MVQTYALHGKNKTKLDARLCHYFSQLHNKSKAKGKEKETIITIHIHSALL